MPDQPSWIDRVPEIIQALETAGDALPYLDRGAIEQVSQSPDAEAVEYDFGWAQCPGAPPGIIAVSSSTIGIWCGGAGTTSSAEDL